MERMLITKTVKIPLTVVPLVQVQKKSITGYKENKMVIYEPFILYMHAS